MRPYLAIIQEVARFLQPYLDGRITRWTEDQDRKEIMEWLPKKIRAAFPYFSAEKLVIESIALTAYLKLGARAVSPKRPNEPYHEKRRREEFVAAIRHSLPIDFRSADFSRFTDDTFSALAREVLSPLRHPISRFWPNTRQIKTIPIS